MPRNMTEPMQMKAFDEDGQFFNIAASLYFVVKGSFLPIYPEDLSHTPVVEYFRPAYILSSQWPGFESISEHGVV